MLYPARQKKQARDTFSLNGFKHGLNTVLPETMIANTEASELVNFKIKKTGRVAGGLETRPPLVAETSVATTSNAAVKVYQRAPINGTDRTIIVDENGLVYYNDSGTPTQIGSLTLESGTVTALPFMGVMLFMDGSYIKYLDGVSTLKIAYDSGTGTSGYQFNNLSGDDDTSIALGNGTNVRVGAKFTSQSWSTGFTIPPTTVQVYLSKNGTPSASAITARLRAVSDDSILASKELLADATDLTATADEYSCTFTTVTTEMSPSTAYYLVLEHTGGDAANYVKVHCTTVTSGGTAYSYAAAYSADTTKTPLMGMRPGRPPKAKYGEVHDGRVWVFDPSNDPGLATVSNRSYTDYSTPDYAGTVGAVDDDENNFPIGGLISLFGDLWFYGTQSQPYLAQLNGSSPADYTIDKVFQKAWTTHKTLVGTVNDAWSASSDGVDSLVGVQEYGDVRTFSESDPVQDRIDDNWDSDTAFAGYNPADGQYFLCMPSYRRVLVSHTKIPVAETNGIGTRHPWSEYEFYKEDLTDSNYYKWTNVTGNIYKLEAAAGGDPGLTQKPDAIVMDGVRLDYETDYSSLTDHEWYYENRGDGYKTVFLSDATGDPDTSGVSIKTIIIPTCFGSFGGEFYIGGDDGFVYKLDPSEYKDQEVVQIEPSMSSGQFETPFNEICLEEFQGVMDSTGGASITFEIYKNNINATPALTFTMLADVSDTLMVKDARMEVQDATFLVERNSSSALSKGLNIDCRSFKIRVKSLTNAGYPVYINGYLLKYRSLAR